MTEFKRLNVLACMYCDSDTTNNVYVYMYLTDSDQVTELAIFAADFRACRVRT
jgi:hypothetical protein